MIEFIIVGRGLAASVIAHTLHQNNISFKLIGAQDLSSSSKVAAGIWNPVVFKRLTKSWLAQDLINCLNGFYTSCETTLNKKLITQRYIIKPFTEDHEKKLWQSKATLELSDFLDDAIYDGNSAGLEHCKIQNQYGKVKQSGNLNVDEFLKTTTSFFKEQVVDEVFDHAQLKINNDGVFYKNNAAKYIVFCEGHLVKNNPFFKWIPLKPAKGEVLTVSVPGLKLQNEIFNKNGFLMRQADGNYKLGATYEWGDLNEYPTQKGSAELESKLKQMISCPYTIIEHQAGIRPSSIDRRPIIGAHPNHKNLFIFNGLGTKGVMLAPYFAKKFVNFYLQKEVLPPEVNVDRFYSLYAD